MNLGELEPNQLPSRKLVIQILQDEGCSKSVINHCKKVSDLALKIARKYHDRNLSVNLELVEMGGLLHDIGRSKTHSVKHAVIGANIARELNLPVAIVNIIERHVGAGIPKDEAQKIGLPKRCFIPLCLEEKIVAYADKLIKGTQQVSYEDAFRDLSLKLGKNHQALKRFKRLHEEISATVREHV
jgi:uncharacterized protein